MKVFLTKNRTLVISLIGVSVMYLFLYSQLNQGLLSHSGADSYTLQALAWWKGQTYLDQNYLYLELALYKNRVFVSFPPFPSVITFFLIPFFGPDTPSNLLTTLYVVLSFIFAFLFCRNRNLSDSISLFWALFLVFGGNLIAISSTGGVWFQAQALNFLLTVLSIYFISLKKQIYWYLSFIFLMFAVGCRPFQIAFFPIILMLLFRNIKQRDEAISLNRLLLKSSVFLIAPAFICMIYALYNYVRFDNPLEFGHNYLPEFINSPEGQFNVSYVLGHIQDVLRLPSFNSDNTLTFPRFNGFAFYIANPIFIPFLTRLISHWLKSLIRLAKTRFQENTLTGLDVLIPLCILANILLTMLHKTLGGWQFGVRYFVDTLPFLFLYILERNSKVHFYEIVLLALGIELNIYGTL